MKKVLFFLSAALLLAVSCNKQQLDAPELDIKGRVSEVSAIMPQTKAVFENDQVMKWQEGDQIGLYVYSTTKDNSTEYTPGFVPYDLASGAGEANATFTHVFEDESLGETYGNVAFYPFSQGSVYHYGDAGGTLDLMLPIEYYVTSLAALQRVNMPMVAVLDMSETGDKSQIYFKHVGGAIKVTVNGLDAKKVAWIELLAWDKRVNGLFTGIDLSAEDPVVEVAPAEQYEDYNDYNNQRRVIISFPEDLELPDPAVFYFPVPAGTYESFSILAYDRNYTQYFAKHTSVSNVVARGTILQMPAFDAPKPIVADSWTIMSSMNQWAEDYATLTRLQGEIWKVENVSFTAGAEFKFRADGDWNKNLGARYGIQIGTEMPVSQNGSDFIIPMSGKYTITLNAEEETVLIEMVAPEFDSYEAFTEYSPWSVIGMIAADQMSWDNDIVMTSNGEWSVAQGVVLTTEDQFKFRKNQDWTVNYGGDDAQVVENGWWFVMSTDAVYSGFSNGANLAVEQDGTYDILFYESSALMVVVPTLGGTHTLAHEPQEPPQPYEGWSVIGTIGGTSWDTDYDMTTEDNVLYTSGALRITANDWFKIRYGHEWGGPDRGMDVEEPAPIGQAFTVVQGGYNISITEDGYYRVIYDSQAETITIDPVPEWGICGSMTGWGNVPDIPMEEQEDNLFVASNVTMTETDEFKIRQFGIWDTSVSINYGGTFVDFGYTFDAIEGGDNIHVGVAGTYNIILDLKNPNSPLIAVLKQSQGITIDGDFDDWANVQGVSNGTHGMFKVASDADNIYFYTWRTTEGRFSELWGTEKGYIYFAFDLDGNADNGVSLNGNGPYDYIGFIYCFGGTSEAPVIEITHAGDCAPDGYTVDNVVVKGKVDSNGAYVEYSIPRADLPEIPKTPVTVTSWGNKDLAKVSITATL